MEIKFAEWVAENHFYLHNVENGVYYWKDEFTTHTTKELYELWHTLKTY